MEKSGAHWKWPQKPDVIWYGINDILEVISAPTVRLSGNKHSPK
jgi:hypothetical protein